MTPMSLSRTTITLHWLVAVGIVGMLGLGLYLVEMPRGPDKVAMIQIHKSIGTLILLLLFARMAWRMRNGFPEPVGLMQPWEHTVSRFTHWFLLIAPLVLVASGIVRSLAYARPVKIFGQPFIPKVIDEKNAFLNDIAGAIHDWLAWALIVVLVLHIAGALRHHLIKKDATLVRMLGFSRNTERGAEQ